jgi:hypothetical protein
MQSSVSAGRPRPASELSSAHVLDDTAGTVGVLEEGRRGVYNASDDDQAPMSVRRPYPAASEAGSTD